MEYLPGLRHPQVQRHADLIAIECLEKQAVLFNGIRCNVSPDVAFCSGVLYFDDLCSEIGKRHRAEGTCAHLRKREDSQSLQR